MQSTSIPAAACDASRPGSPRSTTRTFAPRLRNAIDKRETDNAATDDDDVPSFHFCIVEGREAERRVRGHQETGGPGET